MAECTAYQAGLYRETLFMYCRSVCLFVYLCIQSSSEGQVAFWRSSEGGCGQGWQGKQTADPHALPCKVGQDFCPPSVLTAAHVCPRTTLVPGLPVLPSMAQGSAVHTGPISCHTVGQSQGLGWSWPSWFGLDSVSRSTGPALVFGAVTPRLPFYCHSSLSSRLSSESYMQRHGTLHLFSHEEMVVMAAAWPGSGLACAWCRRACRAVLPASPQNSSLSFHGEGM